MIFTASGTQTAQAEQAATSTIPVVFVIGTDPVKFRLVASMNRPGGNVTGVTLLTTSMAQKRLDVLREMVPTATRFALLLNPRNPNFDLLREEVQEAARSIGRETLVLSVSSEADFDRAFEKLVEEKAQGQDRGLWFLEAGFGPCHSTSQPTFRDLEGAARWISERLREFSKA